MTTRLRILHVEDDAFDAELVESALVEDGLACEMRRVSTEEEFVAALEKADFDLILSDFALPGFDGDTAQQLAFARLPHVPFIFVSGTLGEEVAVERLKAGATDYVLKQRLTRLPGVVRRALEEMRGREERQRAAEEVRRLNAELEQRVIDRTRQLASANEQLAERQRELTEAKTAAERANRAKSVFLSHMSHDLRTPLNAILGFAQLLDLEVATPDQHESISQILKAGRHLLELINEVLDIARIESGQLSLSPEPVLVSDVTRLVVDMVRPLASLRGISITCDGGAHWVLADRQRLRQILLNLLSNAVKYNRDGGQVRVICHKTDPDRVRISVVDTGVGMRSAQRALLFRPFERLGAESSGVEGTGLGLALSKGLVDAMNGTIGVESVQGEGSTFWIELPAGNPSAAQLADPDGQSIESGAPEVTGTVLYVEDNTSNARLMERLLRRRPRVRLLFASSGELGLAVAREERPDLIFLDLHLPDISGDQVLRRLWQEPSTRHIPVVILTADANPAKPRRMLERGAQSYLTKPIDLGRVLALVDEQLGAKRTG